MRAIDKGQGRVSPRGGVWWIAYYHPANVQHRESSKSADHDDAVRLLRQRLKETGAAEIDPARKFVTPQARRQTIADLLDALTADYKIRGKGSPENLCRLRQVKAAFGTVRAADLTEAAVLRYIEEQLTAGYAKASINRVTQILRKAFKDFSGGIPAPRIPQLSEIDNVRQGFYSDEETNALIDALPEHLKDFTLFAARTEMRCREIESLEWADVDGDVIRLRAVNAKTRTARCVPMIGELADLLERRRAVRTVMVNNTATLARWIFHDEAGRKIIESRKIWIEACCKVGLGQLICRNCDQAVGADLKCEKCGVAWHWKKLLYVGRLFHDFRRTGVRNLLRAGVTEGTAMKISGHKTRAMLDRYNIVDDHDVREALARAEEFRKTHREERKVVEMAPEPRRTVGAQSGAQLKRAAKVSGPK